MASTALRVGVTTELNERAGVRLREIAPEAEIVLLDTDGNWSADPDALDAFFFSEDLYYLPESFGAFLSLLESSPPKWMQTASTGVDHALFASLLQSGAIVTNSPGVHGSAIAEYVFAYILSHAKRLPQHAANQSDHRWTPLESVELAGQTHRNRRLRRHRRGLRQTRQSIRHEDHRHQTPPAEQPVPRSARRPRAIARTARSERLCRALLSAHGSNDESPGRRCIGRDAASRAPDQCGARPRR